MSKLEKQFALYRSDEYIYGGTIKEIAQKTGVPLATLRFCATRTYRKRVESQRAKRGVTNGLELIEVVDD